MFEVNYDERIYNDIQLVKSARKIEKRELGIFLGASLLGLTCYGIMKSSGIDDLTSNYPMLSLYGLAYLEYYRFRKEAAKAYYRLQGLVSETVDPEEKDSFYEALINSKHGSISREIKDSEGESSSLVDEYTFEDEEKGKLVQISNWNQNNKGEETRTIKTLKLTKEEAKTKSF